MKKTHQLNWSVHPLGWSRSRWRHWFAFELREKWEEKRERNSLSAIEDKSRTLPSETEKKKRVETSTVKESFPILCRFRVIRQDNRLVLFLNKKKREKERRRPTDLFIGQMVSSSTWSGNVFLIYFRPFWQQMTLQLVPSSSTPLFQFHGMCCHNVCWHIRRCWRFFR